MKSLRTNSTIWDIAPDFGTGEHKIPAVYLSYSQHECYWSTEPPIVLSNHRFKFPIGVYREAMKPPIKAPKGQIIISFREEK
jgi:hypothetical protein